MIVARAVLDSYDKLWTLATGCQPWLGSWEALMAMAEDAVGSRLEPWSKLPRRRWILGRVFGSTGELRWRAYGPAIRVVLVSDGLPRGAQAAEADEVGRLQGVGFAEVEAPALPRPISETLLLWRTDAYQEATVRRYRDDTGGDLFVCYCEVK
jgi:hypothetical protein